MLQLHTPRDEVVDVPTDKSVTCILGFSRSGRPHTVQRSLRAIFCWTVMHELKYITVILFILNVNNTDMTLYCSGSMTRASE